MEEELFNATGCELIIGDNGKISVKRPEIGSMIHVNTGSSSTGMIVHSYEGNHICCDNDGVEACVCLTKNGDVLIWKDITE
jgi:hypothetical protein